MPSQERSKLTDALLDYYGCTFCERAGINIERGTPKPLFELLCGALLFSAPIDARSALRALRALMRADLTTPSKMAQASWQQRVDAITDEGYKRYDEKTATQLGELAERVQHAYHGDLRELRSEARHDPEREKQLLTEFNGIGPVGADIFLREVQGVWAEAYPYVDAKVLASAQKLHLGSSAEELAELVPKSQFPALVASLVQLDLDGAHERVRQAAA